MHTVLGFTETSPKAGSLLSDKEHLASYKGLGDTDDAFPSGAFFSDDDRIGG